MKLSHECVRDVMLAIEEIPYRHYIESNKFIVKDYDKDEINYTIKRLYEAGFLDAKDQSTLSDYEFTVMSLSYYGHQFLGNIRPQGSWDKTKKAANKVGSVSIDILATFAAKVTAELIAKQLGINNNDA